MYTPFDENLPRSVQLLGVLFVAVAFVGWAFLGWEYGAGFGEQPIPFVLGVCGFVVAIGIGLWQMVGE